MLRTKIFISAVFVLGILLGWYFHGLSFPKKEQYPSVDVVQTYVFRVISGNWEDAKYLTTGKLYSKLKKTDVTHIDRGEIIDHAAVSLLKGTKVDIVRSKVKYTLQGGLPRTQELYYYLYFDENQWRIFKVEDRQPAGVEAALEPASSSSSEKIMKDFTRLIVLGDWNKAKELTTDRAREGFDTPISPNSIPNTNIRIENWKAESLGVSGSVEFWLANYEVIYPDTDKQLTTLFLIDSATGLIADLSVIEEK